MSTRQNNKINNFLLFGLVVIVAVVGGCSSAGKFGNGDSDDYEDNCLPFERVCHEGNVFRCSSSGIAWVLLDECTEGCSKGYCSESVCVPDCTNKVCGDDGCGEDCGSCDLNQEICMAGECVCQPACEEKDCGDDGCGGECGECDLQSSFCDDTQICQPCESGVCGVCDEIDVNEIVHYQGRIGGDHELDNLRAEVFTWPITTDMSFDLTGSWPCFYLHHFEGESWLPDTENNLSDAAAMVACYHSISHNGIVCETYEWYSPDHNVCRNMFWKEGHPVAHVFISAVEEKRTPIKFFSTWPYHPIPSYSNVDPNDVGMQLSERICH